MDSRWRFHQCSVMYSVYVDDLVNLQANCCGVVTLEFKLAETNLPSLYPVDIKKL